MFRSVAEACTSGKLRGEAIRGIQEARGKFIKTLLHFLHHSGVVQLVAHGPLEPRILVRVQAPEPLHFSMLTPLLCGVDAGFASGLSRAHQVLPALR